MTRPYDHMHEGSSEFGGETGPAGIHYKGSDALTASEKLRLGYLTGTEDPAAPVDRRVWEGLDPAKWDELVEKYDPMEESES